MNKAPWKQRALGKGPESRNSETLPGFLDQEQLNFPTYLGGVGRRVARGKCSKGGESQFTPRSEPDCYPDSSPI